MTGTSARMYGSAARMACPPPPPPAAARAMSLMAREDVARDAPSVWERTSAFREYLPPGGGRNTYTWLLAIRSWATNTFSEPLTMK